MQNNERADRPTTEGGVWGSYVEYLKMLEGDIDQIRVERDWLLAEAPDDLRERFFSIRAKQWRDAIQRRQSGSTP